MSVTVERDPLRIRHSRLGPHSPTPPQHAFLWLDCFEALYGGAAGGGKSDALLMAALQYVDQPHYNALILRKTFADLALPGAIMDRSKEWLAGTSDARWSEIEKTWRFPSGATLTFGYLQTTNDKYRYQGADFHYIGFDELTQFDEADYVYLASRIRKAEGDVVPLRLRGATNPGGRGHRWVKRRFIDKQPRENDPTDTPEKCRARVFIPAKLADNPHIDQDAYRMALDLLDPETRAQLLDGDWEAREPGLWAFDAEGIGAALRLGASFDLLRASGGLQPPAGGSIELGIDWGERTVCLVLYPLEAGGVYVTDEIIGVSSEPGASTHRMLDAAAEHPWPTTQAAYDSAGVQSMRTFMAVAEERSLCHAGDRNRLVQVSVPFNRFKRDSHGYLRRLFDRAKRGEPVQVIAVSPRCRVLRDQLRDLQVDENGDIVKGNDHAADALIAGVAPTAHRHRSTIIANGNGHANGNGRRPVLA